MKTGNERTLKAIIQRLMFSRLYLPLLILSALTVLTTAVLQSRAQAVQQQQLARAIASLADDYLHQATRVMRVITLNVEDAPPELIQRQLESTWLAHGHFNTLYRLNGEGIVVQVAPRHPDLLGLDMSGQPFFRESAPGVGPSQPTVSRPFMSSRTGAPTVYLSQRVADGSLIVGELNLGALQLILRNQAPPGGQPRRGLARWLPGGATTTFIADEAGNLIAHTNPVLVAQQVNVSDLALLNGMPAAGTTRIYHHDDAWFLGSVSPLTRSAWAVGVQAPIAVALGPYVVSALGMLALAALGWLIPAWIVERRLDQQVIAPLIRLSRDANALASGHYEENGDWADPAASFAEIDTLAANFRDMARSIQARQAALESSRSSLHLIMQNVPAGVVLLSQSGQVIVANPQARSALSLLAGRGTDAPLTRLGNRSLSELLLPPQPGLWHEVIGEGRSFEVLTVEVPGADPADMWVMLLRETTRERVLQQHFQQQQQLAAVGQLAAGIAHDFNNIIAVIILYAQLIDQSLNLHPRDRQRLRAIREQAQRAAELIEQILDFSRRSVLRMSFLDLEPFLKEQVKLLRRIVPENIVVDLHIEPANAGLLGPDRAFVIHADPTRIQQAIMNLVLNARDAMPEGGTLRIAMRRSTGPALEADGTPPPKAWVEIAVSDTGIGIDADTMQHLFEPFFTTKGPGRGTGLGLPQVHGIMQLHNGDVVVHSEVNRGTTFTLYFPVADSAVVADAEHATPPSAMGRGERILLVEDNEAIRQAIAETLHTLNYRVIQAGNGREAIEILEKYASSIALLLSDMIMPEIGGVALLREARQRGWSMPAILMTGHPLGEQHEDLSDLGTVEVLTKPLRLERLSELITRFLQQAPPD